MLAWQWRGEYRPSHSDDSGHIAEWSHLRPQINLVRQNE
jgi:hypothetical protein